MGFVMLTTKSVTFFLATLWNQRSSSAALELEVAQLFKSFNITKCFQIPILTGVLFKFYPTVQGSGRSPSSLLCASPLSQTIRGVGNHCLWFPTSAVRNDFLTSEKVAHEEKLRVWSTPLQKVTTCTFPTSLWHNSQHRSVPVPCHAVSLVSSKHISNRTWPLAGGKEYSPSAATCVNFLCRNQFTTWLWRHRTWTAYSTVGVSIIFPSLCNWRWPRALCSRLFLLWWGRSTVLVPCPFQGEGLGRSRKDHQWRFLGRECRSTSEMVAFRGIRGYGPEESARCDVLCHCRAAHCPMRLASCNTFNSQTTLELASLDSLLLNTKLQNT